MLCAVLRIAVIERQGLWADEFFSLANATGHSLEHPAVRADVSQGDYVEPPGPVPSSQFARYLEHDAAPAGPLRVIRAVRLSDLNPPLYYLTLWGWTRAFGTSDWTLRLLSTVFALGCFPLLWRLALRLDRRAAIPACLLFTIAPSSIYYSTEGRMYSLVWFFVLGLSLLSVELYRRGPGRWRIALWILSGVGGLYTHYFFIFPFSACCAWLLIRPGRLPRKALIGASMLTVMLVLPYYIDFPQSMERWRVTKDWLTWKPVGYTRTSAPFTLAWSLLSGGQDGLWDGGRRANRLALATFAAVLLALIWKLRWRALEGKRMLLWLWLAAAIAGPFAVDLLRNTYVSAVPRYATAGMPAAILLVALGLARLTRTAQVVAILLVVAGWQSGMRAVYRLQSRNAQPIRELARQVAEQPPDLLILHGIPSAVAGFARYLPRDIPTLSWVGQLDVRRAPGDIQSAIAGRHTVMLIDVHSVEAPTDDIDWLRSHSREISEPLPPVALYNTLRVFRFVPREGATFAAGP